MKIFTTQKRKTQKTDENEIKKMGHTKRIHSITVKNVKGCSKLYIHQRTKMNWIIYQAGFQSTSIIGCVQNVKMVKMIKKIIIRFSLLLVNIITILCMYLKGALKMTVNKISELNGRRSDALLSFDSLLFLRCKNGS
jgi:hypothetical protein